MKNNNYLFNLDYFAALKVSGPDATQFLQGQLTCDVLPLDSNSASLGAHCDHKGRMLANFWIFKWQEAYYLWLPENMLAILREHLNKYAVFSKITLELADFTSLGLQVNCLKENQRKALNLPLHINETQQTHNYTIVKIPGGNDRFILFVNTEYAEQLQLELEKNFIFGEVNSWNLQDIKAHLTYLQPKTSALLTPQMIDLQKLGGVSFTKGCYLGQEVVARTEHLGKLKRHLHLITIHTKLPPKIGDELTDKNKVSLGIIAAAAKTSDASYEVLAVLQDRALETVLFYKNKDIKIIINDITAK